MAAPRSYFGSYCLESSADWVTEAPRSQADQQACSTTIVDLACPLSKLGLKTCRRQLASWMDYLLVSHSASLLQTMPLQGRWTEAPKHYQASVKKTGHRSLRPSIVISLHSPTTVLPIASPEDAGRGVSPDSRLQHPMSTSSCIRNIRGQGRGTGSNRVGAGHIVLLAWSRQSSRRTLR